VLASWESNIGVTVDCVTLRFRSFISVDIEPTDSLAALLESLRSADADLKVVKPGNLHVTLKFLGNIDDTAVDEVALRIERAAEGLPPFRTIMRGMGAFPSLSNIRVIWVGLENAEGLSMLAERLDSSLLELDFEKDKKGFKPHLTVARTRSARGAAGLHELINSNVATEFGSSEVGRITLKKSVLTPQGPQYSDIREIPLRDGEGS
jgi:2'-5' RNA ligase